MHKMRGIENGMEPKTLQKILGHNSLQMTMDLYCHVRESTLTDPEDRRYTVSPMWRSLQT